MRTRAAVVLLVMTMLVSGCSAPGPQASSPPPQTQTPTPTPTPTPVASGPTTRFDLECADFEPPDPTAFALAVAPHDPIAAYAGAVGSLPRLSHIQAIGGLVCEWSNGVPHSSVRGTAPDYAGILVSILPAAAEQWARYAKTYRIEGARNVNCVPDVAFCGIDELVGEYWIGAEAQGVADSAAIDAAVATMAEALRSLPASRPVWTPPAGTTPLGTSCTDIVALSDVAAAMALPDEVAAVGGHGGWSQYASAMEDLATPSCFWSYPGEETYLGQISAVVGGAALGQAYVAVATSPTTASPLPLDGLADGDVAWERCSDSACYVDIIAGGDWVQVSVESLNVPEDPKVATRTLATKALESLYR